MDGLLILEDRQMDGQGFGRVGVHIQNAYLLLIQVCLSVCVCVRVYLGVATDYFHRPFLSLPVSFQNMLGSLFVTQIDTHLRLDANCLEDLPLLTAFHKSFARLPGVAVCFFARTQYKSCEIVTMYVIIFILWRILCTCPLCSLCTSMRSCLFPAIHSVIHYSSMHYVYYDGVACCMFI